MVCGPWVCTTSQTRSVGAPGLPEGSCCSRPREDDDARSTQHQCWVVGCSVHEVGVHRKRHVTNAMRLGESQHPGFLYAEIRPREASASWRRTGAGTLHKAGASDADGLWCEIWSWGHPLHSSKDMASGDTNPSSTRVFDPRCTPAEFDLRVVWTAFDLDGPSAAAAIASHPEGFEVVGEATFRVDESTAQEMFLQLKSAASPAAEKHEQRIRHGCVGYVAISLQLTWWAKRGLSRASSPSEFRSDCSRQRIRFPIWKEDDLQPFSDQ